MTSANWDAAATGMRNTKRGAILLGGVLGYAAGASPDPRGRLIGAIGVVVMGIIGQEAGDMEQQFQENAQRAREEEQKAEQARQVAAEQERQRQEEERRQREAEQRRAAEFQRHLDDAYDRHRERVRSGDFIREYQDTPIRERDYSNYA